jgi:hypothetical protein
MRLLQALRGESGNGRRELARTRTLRTDPFMLEEVRRLSSCFRPWTCAAGGDDFDPRIESRCHVSVTA